MLALNFDPKSLVAAAAARGLCSAPVFTPPRTSTQIQTLRLHARGLNSRGRPPSDRKGGTISQLDAPFRHFITRYQGIFSIGQFQTYIIRQGLHLTTNYVYSYLRAKTKSGHLQRISSRYEKPARYMAAPKLQTSFNQRRTARAESVAASRGESLGQDQAGSLPSHSVGPSPIRVGPTGVESVSGNGTCVDPTLHHPSSVIRH
jgi:hypothetical protein